MYTRKWVRTVVVWVRVCNCMSGARAYSDAGAEESNRNGVCPTTTVSRKERREKTRKLGGEEGEEAGLKVVGITQVGRVGEWIVEG